MDDNKQKELIMDEIKIEELQEISGGVIPTLPLIGIPLRPLVLGGVITVPNVISTIPLLALNVISGNKNK